MAWSVDTLYKFVLYQTRSNQSGRISASDFFYAWNSEQSTYFQDLLGRFQNRNNGKEGVNTGFIQNETVETKIAPFIKPPTTITVSAGNANKPPDFAYELALRINGKKVVKINHDQIAYATGSVIDPPSITDNTYYCTEYAGYYSILPSSVTALVLDYISQPLDVVWNFILDADERQIYTPTGSVQPAWLQNDLLEITKRAMKSFGVSLKDADFAKFGESVQITGE